MFQGLDEILQIGSCNEFVTEPLAQHLVQRDIGCLTILQALSQATGDAVIFIEGIILATAGSHRVILEKML